MILADTVLLDAVTTGTSDAVKVAGVAAMTLYVTWNASVTGGAVTWEAAPYENANDALWVSLGAITYASGAPKTEIDTETATHAWVRARVSTNVTGTGGKVTVRLLARD